MVRDNDGDIIGALCASGDNFDKDEVCAMAGRPKAGHGAGYSLAPAAAAAVGDIAAPSPAAKSACDQR